MAPGRLARRRDGEKAGDPTSCRPRGAAGARPSAPRSAGGAAGQALEPGNRKRRRGRAGRLLGAGDQAGSTPCAPPPPDASPQRLVRKWVLRGVWRGPRGCPQDQRPRGLQGTWACFGPDCAPASLRTWSSFCRAAGSRQVTVGARLCGPHGWAQRGGWPRPWPTGWGPSPASDAHSLLAELGRVGLGKPRSRRARTPHCGLGAAPAPSAPLVRVGEEKSRAGVWGVPCRASTPRVLFSVVDLVSADLEEVAQKCGLSYKVSWRSPSMGVSKCPSPSRVSPEIDKVGGLGDPGWPPPLAGSLPHTPGCSGSFLSCPAPSAGPGRPAAGAAGSVLCFSLQWR